LRIKRKKFRIGVDDAQKLAQGLWHGSHHGDRNLQTKIHMKIQNAINKLTKAGFEISTDRNSFVAKKDGLRKVITFIRNGHSDDAVCIGYRYEEDKSDPMSDYCATLFCDTLTKAIRSVTS